MASKKDGKLRFWADYRTLNWITVPDRWPLPKIEEIFDDLKGNQVFTTLDLFSDYWQVQMEGNCKAMTTFVTRYGTYQFQVMSFGLMNVLATFQRMMDGILKGTSFADAYFDDVVVFPKLMEGHVSHLQHIFALIAMHKICLQTAKCEFAKAEVLLLRHIVSAQETYVYPKKIEAIKEALAPHDTTSLRSFPGPAEYYRRFIKIFAEISFQM